MNIARERERDLISYVGRYVMNLHWKRGLKVRERESVGVCVVCVMEVPGFGQRFIVTLFTMRSPLELED